MSTRTGELCALSNGKGTAVAAHVASTTRVVFAGSGSALCGKSGGGHVSRFTSVANGLVRRAWQSVFGMPKMAIRTRPLAIRCRHSSLHKDAVGCQRLAAVRSGRGACYLSFPLRFFDVPCIRTIIADAHPIIFFCVAQPLRQHTKLAWLARLRPSLSSSMC